LDQYQAELEATEARAARVLSNSRAELLLIVEQKNRELASANQGARVQGWAWQSYRDWWDYTAAQLQLRARRAPAVASVSGCRGGPLICAATNEVAWRHDKLLMMCRSRLHA
jgi:hypothetical protein